MSAPALEPLLSVRARDPKPLRFMAILAATSITTFGAPFQSETPLAAEPTASHTVGRATVAARPAETPASGRTTPVAKALLDLRASTLLKDDELGALFGVTRRSIQNWLAGASLAARHERRVYELAGLLQGLDARPEEIRGAFRGAAGHLPLLDDAAELPIAVVARRLGLALGLDVHSMVGHSSDAGRAKPIHRGSESDRYTPHIFGRPTS